MQDFIKTIVSLGIWNTLDVQFAKNLANSVFNTNQYDSQNIKKTTLILASAYLSAYTRSGHTCLPLSVLAFNKILKNHQNLKLTCTNIRKIKNLSINDWQEILLSISAIGNGCSITPLILDNEHLYLHRMWKDECIVAQFFNENTYDNSNVFQKKIIDILNILFPDTSKTTNWHKIATALTLIHSKVLISGGPGTGKTTIISKIITALLLYNSNFRIRITAPTGKSAAILTYSCRNVLNHIQHLYQSKQCTLKLQATTIHNFLGLQLYNKKKYNYSHILDLDYLIIDESSMISLSMLARLILALPKTTKVILLGDQNQLYSIAPGSVFKDVCQFSNFYYSLKRQQELTVLTGYTLPIINKHDNTQNHISDGICILKKNYRFDKTSGINQLASAVNSGNYEKTLSILNHKKYPEINYFYLKHTKDYINMIEHCSTQYYQYLKQVQHHKILITDILKKFDNYRILCALKKGPFGVNQLNYYIEHILNYKKLITLNDSANYIGRPIMILQNSPELELYNGDIGILLPNSQNCLSAYFLTASETIKTVQINQLPIHETCFAMTIHKSQGSSFPNVTIIFPNKYMPILTRELLYTAITRTQQTLTLYATDEVLISTINVNTQRHSCLFNRINKK